MRPGPGAQSIAADRVEVPRDGSVNERRGGNRGRQGQIDPDRVALVGADAVADDREALLVAGPYDLEELLARQGDAVRRAPREENVDVDPAVSVEQDTGRLWPVPQHEA